MIRKTNILTLMLLGMLSIAGFSQTEKSLEITGMVEMGQNPLSNAVIELFENNIKIETRHSNSSGEFNFVLKYNKNYSIVVGKKGYISKRINFNTEVAPENQTDLAFGFALGLVEYCEGVDVSAFDQPVDNISYNVKKNEFESDKRYVDRQQAIFGRLYYELEDCKIEKYNQAISEADRLFGQKKYDEAIEKYQEALAMQPENPYPKRRIDEINQKAGQEVAINNQYNAAILEADALLSQNRLDEAKQKFQQAQMLKPAESYPRQKVQEIDTKQKNVQQQNALENNYNQLMLQANDAYSAKDYSKAKTLYQQALGIKPESPLARGRMSEIDALLARNQEMTETKKQQEKAFDQAMAEAASLMAARQYTKAKEAYQKAMTLNPQSSAPQQKLSQIDALVAEEQRAGQQAKQAEQDKLFEQALALADNYYKNKEYQPALQNYQKALDIKPSDVYTKQRIDRVNNLIQADIASKQQEIETGYNTAMSQGQDLQSKRLYAEAQSQYEKALSYKPNDAMATRQINELSGLIQQQQLDNKRELELNQRYNTIIAKADGLLQAKDYAGAKTEYQNALAVIPGKPYPSQKMQEIDRIIASDQARKQQEIESGYNGAVAQGQDLMSKQMYAEARPQFEKALTYKPNDPLATGKLTEISRLIQQQELKNKQEQELSRQYNASVAKADGLFQAKDYTGARSEYQNALAVMPSKPYPSQKIQEIDRIIAADQARKVQETEKGYQAAMAEGNGYFGRNDLANAKNAFKNALNYKANDSSAQSKIAQIDQMLQKQQEQIAAEETKNRQYKEAITLADNYFAGKQYSQAKTSYENAGQIKPAETYPKAKISEINRIIEDQQRLQAEQQALENSYKLAISSADGLFNKKEYAQARADYQKALSFKPTETYPSDRIREIDRNLASQKQTAENARLKEAEYQQAITRGDQLFAQKQYAESKNFYNRALAAKPDVAYPKEQIVKIDNLLALAEQQKREELLSQKAYTDAIAAADKAFNAADYTTALQKYREASELKPDESYPKLRISKIEEINRLLAQQQKQPVSNNSATKSNDPPPALKELIFKDDSERDKYLNNLKAEYPSGITVEVYKEKFKTTRRIIVVRDNLANEYREVKYNWGTEHFQNDKRVNVQYFNQQTGKRPGEYYKETVKQ
ncbi:MAG: tetratricopeptide repeat protein [Bacteroidales bacterium]|nr:tetratricopeptide repeat protein [Bacteroidales bacterium]